MQSLYRALVAAVLCFPLFLAAPIAAAADLGVLASFPSANQTGAPRRGLTATLIFSSSWRDFGSIANAIAASGYSTGS